MLTKQHIRNCVPLAFLLWQKALNGSKRKYFENSLKKSKANYITVNRKAKTYEKEEKNLKSTEETKKSKLNKNNLVHLNRNCSARLFSFESFLSLHFCLNTFIRLFIPKHLYLLSVSACCSTEFGI